MPNAAPWLSRWARLRRWARLDCARLRRWARLAALCVVLGVAMLGVAVVLTPLPPELRESATESSIRVEDRHGHLLREVRASDASRARFVPLEECGQRVKDALIAAEDRRFYRHPGVDPVAALRAALSDLRSRRIVSGASTLTMQLARTVRPHPRGLVGKLRDIVLALRIEASLSKDRILEQYLNRVSFGPGLRGVSAASHAYFDRPPDRLSVAEAALLAAMPRSPTLYDPMRHPETARRRRDRILGRMQAAGMLEADAAARAMEEPLHVRAQWPVFGAPHFVQALVSGKLGPGHVARTAKSTLDGRLQRTAEVAAETTIRDLAGKSLSAAAVLAVENDTGDVLAYVGSPDFWNEAAQGQNDGVRAQRQPGSALKPFLYELALEKLDFDAATLLPDIEIHVPIQNGDYAPRNYDNRFRGPVRLREALGNSFNVPAVWTIERLGVATFLDRLRELGLATLTESPTYYGPALALGDGEVTLLDLTLAYATLARGGSWRPLRVLADAEVVASRPLLSSLAVSQITDILKDRRARAASFGEGTVLDFPFEVAAKTGTSKGYRDNWAIGFTREVTVGVWVGNFDGRPMNGTTGITGAGPIFHAVMLAAMRDRPSRPLVPLAGSSSPEGLVRTSICPLSGHRPSDACQQRIEEWVPPSHAQAIPACSMHIRRKVERKSGLLAGPACAPADVEDRVFEQFPPEYAAWAKLARRPVAPEASSPMCPVAAGDGGASAGSLSEERALRIAYPLSGARFVINPDSDLEVQRLEVQIGVPAGVREVELWVDGRSVGRGGAPFRVSWQLAPGKHELVALAPGVEASPPVTIFVR